MKRRILFMISIMVIGLAGCTRQLPEQETDGTEPISESEPTLELSKPPVSPEVKEKDTDGQEKESEEAQKAESFEDYDCMAALFETHGIHFGTVINYNNLKDTKFLTLVKTHFNSLTAGNEMKAYSLLDQKASKNSPDGMPVMNFSKADPILAFAKDNGIAVRGHTLVWDAYMADWFFQENYDYNTDYVDSETMKKRLESYITQVITYFETNYPGVVYCWDVVNEGVGDAAADYETGDECHIRKYRNGQENLFYRLIGNDYIELSFLYAKNAVEALQETHPTSEIKLFYNDYNTFYQEKRDAICKLIQQINSCAKDESGGYRMLCDGIGMQSYIGGYGTQQGCMNPEDISRIKKAIELYASQGLEVHVTEMAVRNYSGEETEIVRHAEFYEELFRMYLAANHGENHPLTGISIWGLVDHPNMKKDDYSYKMNGPYCGLFDSDYQVKDSFRKIYELLK